MTSTSPRLVGLAAALLAAVPAMAGAAEPPQAGNLDTCTKAINVLGASMGYSEFKDQAGRTKYKFKLRTNGLDYDAVCDAATGVVGDVAPHHGTSSEAQG